MRTTLDIDDDVLFAAKELAVKEKKTAGKVFSEFFRRGLQKGESGIGDGKTGAPYALRNGIPILPCRDEVITSEHIQNLMEQEGIQPSCGTFLISTSSSR